MIILLPFLICLIGLVTYLIATNPKVQEVGRLMFFTGLFITLLGSREVLSLVIK